MSRIVMLYSEQCLHLPKRKNGISEIVFENKHLLNWCEATTKKDLFKFIQECLDFGCSQESQIQYWSNKTGKVLEPFDLRSLMESCNFQPTKADPQEKCVVYVTNKTKGRGALPDNDFLMRDWVKVCTPQEKNNEFAEMKKIYKKRHPFDRKSPYANEETNRWHKGLYVNSAIVDTKGEVVRESVQMWSN